MISALPSDVRGAVQIEFLLAVVPLFLLLVGLTQWALLMAAQLVVQHAAERGVRAAAVILNDSADEYGGAELGEVGGHDGQPFTERHDAIARAVGWPLQAIAPDPLVTTAAVTGDAPVAGALASGSVSAIASQAFGPLASSAEISFPVAAHSAETHANRIPLRGDIHLRVRHELDCLVPLARNLMCERAPGLLGSLRRVHVLEGEASFPSQHAAYDASNADGD